MPTRARPTGRPAGVGAWGPDDQDGMPREDSAFTCLWLRQTGLLLPTAVADWAGTVEGKQTPCPRPQAATLRAGSPAGPGRQRREHRPPHKGAARTRPLSAPTQALTSDPLATTLPSVDWTLASDHVNPGQSQLKQTLPPDLGFAGAAQQARVWGPQVPSLDCCCPRCCPWRATVGELAP